MRRLFLVLAVLLAPAIARAQAFPDPVVWFNSPRSSFAAGAAISGGTNSTLCFKDSAGAFQCSATVDGSGVTQLRLGAGSVGTPSYSFPSSTGTGLFDRGASNNTVSVAVGGAAAAEFHSGLATFYVPSNWFIGFSSTTGFGATDATLGRGGAGSVNVSVGTGTARPTLGGVLCKGVPNVATTGTAEEVLATCTIPANTLTANGAAISVTFQTSLAATGTAKQIRIRLGGIGGTVVWDTSNSLVVSNRTFGGPPVTIWRASSTTANSAGVISDTPALGTGGPATVTFGESVAGASVTWANSNDLVITATDGTTANTTLKSFAVEIKQ